MRFNSGQIIIISIIGFIASLALHLLTILKIYFAGNPEIIILTAGMIIALIQVSRELKNVEQEATGSNKLRLIINQMPHWMKYGLIILGVYSFFNFAQAITPNAGKGYLSLEVPPYKIRIISGFWMLGYAMVSCVVYMLQKVGGTAQNDADTD
jgi:hypothetical protein